MNYDRLIIVPVGTSLLSKIPASLMKDQINFQKLQDCCKEEGVKQKFLPSSGVDFQTLLENNNLKTFVVTYLKEVNPEYFLELRAKGEIKHPAQDMLSAELASLGMLYMVEKENGSKQSRDKILLIASDSDAGVFCACMVRQVLLSNSFFQTRVSFVEILRVEGLSMGEDQDTKTQLQPSPREGISKLASELIEIMQREKNLILINITGGYKSPLPYLVLLGLCTAQAEIFYLYELSPKIIWMPKLPISFDLLTWRDLRGYLLSIPHMEEVPIGWLEEAIGEFRNLFEIAGEQVYPQPQMAKLRLNPVGKAFVRYYRQKKAGDITQFGRGYLLTDHIQNEKKRLALRQCIDRWQYISIGDQIPETVEHSRGHSQRLLEIAAQMLFPVLHGEPGKESFLGKNLEERDNNLIALLSGIWLHDIGHSWGYVHQAKDGKYYLDANSKSFLTKNFYQLTRDLHHFLSAEMIHREKDELFKSLKDEKWQKDPDVFDDEMVQAIEDICLYHRQTMPVNEGEAGTYPLVGKISLPLVKITNTRVNVPLITAILRIIDEGEEQEERAIGDAYLMVRKSQYHRDSDLLKEKISALSKILEPEMEKITNTELNSLKKLFDLINQNDPEALFPKIAEKSGDLSKYKKNAEQLKEATCSFLESLESGAFTPSISVILRDWLEALDNFAFIQRQPSHFQQHRGLSAVFYLPILNEKSGYRYQVRIVVKGGKEEEQKEWKANAMKVLENIKDEYKQLKPILNGYKIYFDFESSSIVEEHVEE